MQRDYELINFERYFIMLCDDSTEEEYLSRNLFGDMARRLENLDEIEPGDMGFLLNIDRDELIGIFRASSELELHIEPDAWNGRFAAQVRVELVGELQRRKDAAYILKKAGLETRQSVSGALVPEYPVHGPEIGENLLARFREPTN